MARRRDVRRYGRGPYVLGMQRGPQPRGDGLPSDVPAVTAIEELALDAPATLVASGNGTGKSTTLQPVLRSTKPNARFIRAALDQ